jgi:hypothetical protein
MLSAFIGVCKALGTVAWMTPLLLVRRRRALAIFQTELRAQGLDHESIKELTATYKELGDFQGWR